jgi:ribosomal protein L10
MQAIRPMGSQILMGKNTLMKRCIRLYCENNKDDSWGAMLDDLVGNVGVLFVRDDFQVTLSHTQAAPQRMPQRITYS